MARPESQRTYCYKDRRYVVAGTNVPAGVIERVYVDMRQGPFRSADVARYCEHALREHGGPVSCSHSLADRIVRDCRDSGVIRVTIQGRPKTWEWSGT